MPVDFLSDEQAAAYGRYAGPPTQADLERLFFLDGDDLALIAARRGDHNRLGFALQATTVRYLGVFLTEDPVDAPWSVIEYLAGQLGIEDPSCIKKYAQRTPTVYEHSWEIREAYGYTELSDGPKGEGFKAFLEGRAWTRAEGPATMFTHAVAWLRGNRVLLPGITVLTRMISQVRDDVAGRQHAAVADAAQSSDVQLPGRLVELLGPVEGHRHSALHVLSRGPKRVSGSPAVAALSRVDRVIGLGAEAVDVSAVPANKLAAMARYGLHSKAPALKEITEPRRTAALVATVRALAASAVDDAIDLFMLLMVTKLINPARKKAEGARLVAMPRLEAASAVLAASQQALTTLLDDPVVVERGTLTVAEAWAAIEHVASREDVRQAVAAVEELVPHDAAQASAAEAALRVHLAERYATVRPFLKALGQAEWLHGAPGGARLLKEVRRLPALASRRVKAEPLTVREVERLLVPKPWFRAVYANAALPDGAVDRDAYVLCLLEQLHAAIRVRDVFAAPSVRYADPRAKLLDGSAWTGVKDQVLAGLGLPNEVDAHLLPQIEALDAAWRLNQARLAEAGDTARVRLVTGADGRAELRVTRPEAVKDSAAVKALRKLVASMLPRIDLPDLLLEVNSWTGFLSSAYLNPAGRQPNLDSLDLSIAALLVSEACNVGHTPVISDHPALTAARLSHIEQQYMRLDNHAAANALFVEHQRTIGFAQQLGGGLVASVDGLRFTVPVASIHTAPAPKYFGYKRGMTWLNAVNDQVMGIGAIVVTGAPRDSPWIIDLMLNLDGGPRPHTVITDAGSYSDMVFGLFALLGYRFCPRLADLGDARYWYAHDHGTPAPDYGNLAGLARNRIDLRKIRSQWPDILRVTGSLVTGAVRAHDLLAMLGRDGRPTPLGAAIAEYGRIPKTIHMLAMADPVDESHHRAVHAQTTVSESRHALARHVFHGRRGQLFQSYRDGQEDQLGALGLVVNAIVLWNTVYIDAIINTLADDGFPLADETVAKLSPLLRKHINVHGTYTFTPPILGGTLRPLREPRADDEDED